MVSFDHKHDHDGECPGCIAALQAAIEIDLNDGEEEFDDGFGDLLDDLHDALAAIHRRRREAYTDKHDMIANSWEFATTLVRIASAVRLAVARGREAMQEPGDDGE
jgi:hypothetical protein